jgi:CubicO group peptidase (beta-lactamase class C family)
MKLFIGLILLFILCLNTSSAQRLIGDGRKQVGDEKEILKFEALFSENSRGFGSIQQRLMFHKVPGLSIATLKDGRLSWAKSYGIKQADSASEVNLDTLFSFGSVSKVVTATLALRLICEGKLSLDEDFNQFLKDWKIPLKDKTNPVTLRQLLSHTSGLNVSGFEDFQPNQALPTTLDILHGRKPAKNTAVTLVHEPRTKFQYSGGGYMAIQLAIEEITQQSFSSAARRYVFQSLNMHRSYFDLPTSTKFLNIAKAHAATGKPTALPRGWESMPEQAASGLWSTPLDMVKLLKALIAAYQGDAQFIIPQKLAVDMMTPVEPSYFGLGVGLIDGTWFFHSGSNDSYKSLIKADLKSGNGFVIVTNGANGSRLVHEIAVVFDEYDLQK